MRKLLKDRDEAGRLLAGRLAAYTRHPDVIVLALPRGGVPLGWAVAQALAAPLDVLIVRKLGMPGHAEYAIGAVAGEGPWLFNAGELAALHLPRELVAAVAARERQEIARREALYRAGRPPPQLRGKTVILIDDGIATGATMHMAVWVVRAAKAAKIVVAVPVAPPEVCAALAPQVDELVCLRTPSPFISVGSWYRDFEQLSDEQVVALLTRGGQDAPARAGMQGFHA